MWISKLLIATVRFAVGATARWEGTPELLRQRIYFANHTSHMNTLVVIAALPAEARRSVKPVAAADYWGTMIKGHGGMLDRMDSICFAAPIFFHLTRYFFSV